MGKSVGLEVIIVGSRMTGMCPVPEIWQSVARIAKIARLKAGDGLRCFIVLMPVSIYALMNIEICFF